MRDLVLALGTCTLVDVAALNLLPVGFGDAAVSLVTAALTITFLRFGLWSLFVPLVAAMIAELASARLFWSPVVPTDERTMWVALLAVAHTFTPLTAAMWLARSEDGGRVGRTRMLQVGMVAPMVPALCVGLSWTPRALDDVGR